MPNKRPRDGKQRSKKPGARKKAPKPRYLVPGERAVSELLAARGGSVKQIWIEQGRDFEELEASATQLGISIQRSERAALEGMVGEGLARGVVAHANPPPMLALDALLSGPAVVGAARQVLVALDEVVDPGNLGAILRSAEFFGVQGVFWAKDRAAPLSSLAVRAGAGATERLALGVVTNLSRALREAKEAGWWVVGTMPAQGRPLAELAAELPERIVIVMGGEGKGLRRMTVENCDFLARIEQVGALASLNVSAASAVMFATLAGAAPKAD